MNGLCKSSVKLQTPIVKIKRSTDHYLDPRHVTSETWRLKDTSLSSSVAHWMAPEPKPCGKACNQANSTSWRFMCIGQNIKAPSVPLVTVLHFQLVVTSTFRFDTNYVVRDYIDKRISLVVVQQLEFIKMASLAHKSQTTGALKCHSPSCYLRVIVIRYVLSSLPNIAVKMRRNELLVILFQTLSPVMCLHPHSSSG